MLLVKNQNSQASTTLEAEKDTTTMYPVTRLLVDWASNMQKQWAGYAASIETLDEGLWLADQLALHHKDECYTLGLNIDFQSQTLRWKVELHSILQLIPTVHCKCRHLLIQMMRMFV